MPQEKIAILGGGVSALVAAYEITSVPNWQSKFDVTVYQQGHRLGGKGASGRNQARENRIEEHGLHIWMGFYENAFHTIRSVYKELNRPANAPLARWDDAFKPHSFIVLDEEVNGVWKSWAFDFPRNNDVPGDGGKLPTPWQYIGHLVHFLKGAFDGVPPNPPAAGGIVQWIQDVIDGIEDLASRIVGVAIHATELTIESFLTLLDWIADKIGSGTPTPGGTLHGAVLDVLKLIAAWAKHWLQKASTISDELRRAFLVVDLVATNAIGMIVDGIIFPPFDFRSIDHLDYKEWLLVHGAHPTTVESPPVNALYDLVFSRPIGIAAGTTVRDTLRMAMTYKGAFFFKMQAGMGDTIFAPLWEVLRSRGVKFEFFHRVEALHLSADKKRVERIDVGVQATMASGGEYLPLFDVKGLPCWPSEPLYGQLVQGAAIQASGADLESFWSTWPNVASKTLVLGADFDRVILGISIGAFPFLCGELIAANPSFKAMVDNVPTCRTQAMQLWFNVDLAGLGWMQQSPVLGTYAKPFDTWADMTHLIQRESFPLGSEPKNLAYLCGYLDEPPPGPDTPASELARVKANCLQWLKVTGTRGIWPSATLGATDELDWSKLVDLSGGVGVARFDAQYHRANTNPSDRYVVTPKGSTAFRLRADESGFSNLVLAGDWVKTGLDGGCVEAATMAGMQAARAVCGSPVVIVGDE